MKIAVIGGGGVRTPLLVNGLVGSDLPIHEIALYDPDQQRLALVAGVARRLCRGVALTTWPAPEACVDGADYVFTSIRVGGIEGRAHDEAVTLAHGVVGQETVGPGGFAMAMRTIPHVVAYARLVERLAPRAWVLNFTNPVGIITQAVQVETGARVVGICDTPTELFEEVAHALGVPSAECYFDFAGLNHLGWLREVYHGGAPQLARLWDDPEALRQVYRAPLFEPDFLRDLRLLPTEYLYYYYRARDAFENVRRAGESRGAVITRLNAELFGALARAPEDPVAVYERYLAVRDAGYMQLESGAPAPLTRSPWAALTGYDKIALQAVRAIHFNANAVMPLDVRNGGNLPELEPDDVVEVPCMVGANGPRPLHVGPLPEAVRPLAMRVKEYERLTVRAALSGDRDEARQALALNPLVDSPARAGRLLDALLPK